MINLTEFLTLHKDKKDRHTSNKINVTKQQKVTFPSQSILISKIECKDTTCQYNPLSAIISKYTKFSHKITKYLYGSSPKKFTTIILLNTENFPIRLQDLTE